MSSLDLRRRGDYADMPRSVAWFIICVREIGLPAVVIGALLYLTYANQVHVTEAMQSVSNALIKLDDGERAIIDTQRLILQRLK